jgi:hypothetical protein
MNALIVASIAASKQSAISPLTDEISDCSNAQPQQPLPVKAALVRSIEESRKARAIDFQQNGILTHDIRIQFTTVTIREYPVTIGDNPASRSGPALTIDWNHDTEVTIPLVDYENQRAPRRKGGEMIIPAPMREDLLHAAGFSRLEIHQGTKSVRTARVQRRRTYETLQWEPVQAWSETVARKTWNVITLGRHQMKEREYLERCVGQNKPKDG